MSEIKALIIPHGFQEHYAVGFANGIAKENIKVDFICADGEDPGLLHPEITWKNLGQNKDANRPTWQKLLRFVFYHWRLILHAVARRGSIIHVIGVLRFEIVTGIMEGLLFRLIGKKYILTVHNLLPHDEHTKTKKRLYRLVYKIPHSLVVHTERMKSELMELFNVPYGKIVVMQHGLSDVVPDHGKQRDACRTILGIPQDYRTLLFFGRLAPYKGLDTLLDAFKELDERFFLVIAGAPSNASYGQKIDNLIAAHPYRDRILCRIRFIRNEDVATYFRAADALIMPYKHIDQSGVMFLSFRFGLPVVAFNVGAINEYVRDDGGVVIDGHRTADLVKGINWFYQNQNYFSPSRIRRYAQRYQWANVLTPIIELYGV